MIWKPTMQNKKEPKATKTKANELTHTKQGQGKVEFVQKFI